MTFEPGFCLLHFVPEGERMFRAEGVPEHGQKKKGGEGDSDPTAQNVNIFLKNQKNK